MSEYGIILCTVGNAENAKQISYALVEDKLAACVSTLSVNSSVYHFEGKLYDEPELLLVIKTRKELFEEVKSLILKLHLYTLPEIVFLPIMDGHAPYLNWIGDETC